MITRFRRRTAAIATLVLAALALAAGPVLAQQSVPNPLRPKPEQAERAKPGEPRRAEPESGAAKPTRERSAKQKENDEMMRACGTQWRAEKVSLQAKGETWRSFLKDCRARKKGEVPA
jgi:hypothetical protein